MTLETEQEPAPMDSPSQRWWATNGHGAGWEHVRKHSLNTVLGMGVELHAGPWRGTDLALKTLVLEALEPDVPAWMAALPVGPGGFLSGVEVRRNPQPIVRSDGV